jgi:hypothetical protein
MESSHVGMLGCVPPAIPIFHYSQPFGRVADEIKRVDDELYDHQTTLVTPGIGCG